MAPCSRLPRRCRTRRETPRTPQPASGSLAAGRVSRWPLRGSCRCPPERDNGMGCGLPRDRRGPFPQEPRAGVQAGLLPRAGSDPDPAPARRRPQPAEGTVQPAQRPQHPRLQLPAPSAAFPSEPAFLPPFLFLSSILLSRSSLDTGFTLISGNFGITPKKYMYILEKKKGEEEKSRAFVPHSCCHAVANLCTGIKCLPLIKQPVVQCYRHGPAEARLLTLEIIWFLRSCLS